MVLQRNPFLDKNIIKIYLNWTWSTRNSDDVMDVLEVMPETRQWPPSDFVVFKFDHFDGSLVHVVQTVVAVLGSSIGNGGGSSIGTQDIQAVETEGVGWSTGSLRNGAHLWRHLRDCFSSNSTAIEINLCDIWLIKLSQIKSFNNLINVSFKN